MSASTRESFLDIQTRVSYSCLTQDTSTFMVRRLLVLFLIGAAAGAAIWYSSRPPTALVLTGIVTTDEIVVSPQIGGRIERLLVD